MPEKIKMAVAINEELAERINELIDSDIRNLSIIPTGSGKVTQTAENTIIDLSNLGGVPAGYTERSVFIGVEGIVREFKILAKLVP